MKLDSRYEIVSEFCDNYPNPMFVIYFCGERLWDSDLWGSNAGDLCPPFETESEALKACEMFEIERKEKGHSYQYKRFRGTWPRCQSIRDMDSRLGRRTEEIHPLFTDFE